MAKKSPPKKKTKSLLPKPLDMTPERGEVTGAQAAHDALDWTCVTCGTVNGVADKYCVNCHRARIDIDDASLFEMAEDTCDVVIDGVRCGAHIGYGMRFLHLRVCDAHREARDAAPPR